jgi:hypothetical protein
MSKVNKEMSEKGFIRVAPSLVYAAASKRREGYLEAFTSVAVVTDGSFFLHKEDFDRIRAEYNPDEESLDAKKERQARNRETHIAGNTPGVKNELTEKINKFLDLEQECPEDAWLSLRSKYAEEFSEKKSTGCTGCQLNAIKSKYRNLLKEL